MRIWAVNVVRLVNVFSQRGSSHLYGRLPVCVLLCRASELESPNVLLHPGYSQPCGFSPVCTRICTSNAERYQICAYTSDYMRRSTEYRSEYLDELLAATLLGAYKWPLAGVYAYVSEQIAPPREPLLALLTRVWLFLSV